MCLSLTLKKKASQENLEAQEMNKSGNRDNYSTRNFYDVYSSKVSAEDVA
jgi:hypothetical protein